MEGTEIGISNMGNPMGEFNQPCYGDMMGIVYDTIWKSDDELM
jgi:hypothetical protein